MLVGITGLCLSLLIAGDVLSTEFGLHIALKILSFNNLLFLLLVAGSTLIAAAIPSFTAYKISPEKGDADPQIAIDKPPHCTATTIEAIDYIEDSLGAGYGFFLEGSAKKYLHRWRHKHDSQDGRLSDLKKASWFLDRLIKDVEGHDVPVCND